MAAAGLAHSTLTDVSMKRGIGEGAMEGIINRHISQQVNWQSIQTITAHS